MIAQAIIELRHSQMTKRSIQFRIDNGIRSGGRLRRQFFGKHFENLKSLLIFAGVQQFAPQFETLGGRALGGGFLP